MVREKLTSIGPLELDRSKSLHRDIQALTILNLRKIKSQEAISAICHEVIASVCKLMVVHIDEGVLEAKKPNKGKYPPIAHTEDERWEDSSIIREDWDSVRWLKKSPNGWVYFDTDGVLLGTIYETERDKGYEVFLNREIADAPNGAKFFILEMRNKLETVMRKKDKKLRNKSK